MAEVGRRAARRILRRSRLWRHEREDVEQDAVTAALEAWRGRPGAHGGYLFSAAINGILAPRVSRRFRADGRLGVGLSDTTSPWERADAALTLGQLAESLTPRLLASLAEEGDGRSDPAHYAARSRAMAHMRGLI